MGEEVVCLSCPRGSVGVREVVTATNKARIRCAIIVDREVWVTVRYVA